MHGSLPHPVAGQASREILKGSRRHSVVAMHGSHYNYHICTAVSKLCLQLLLPKMLAPASCLSV
jgi:hypothetical protein